MATAFIGFGSNIGDKIGFIESAAAKLKESNGISSLEMSSMYRTAPVGKTDQDWFVNAVGKVDTSLSAEGLFAACVEVERQFNRERKERWGPRTIDLDILLFDEIEIETEQLKVPHPRMFERAFVLVPLAELEPELLLRGTSICDLISAIGVYDVSLLENS